MGGSMRYFGTDGIRGKETFFTHEFLIKAAAAASAAAPIPRIMLARDPRVSGKRIEDELTAELVKRGNTVFSAGMTPTPVLAHLTRAYGCGLGIMVSASHNPPEYNGIKFFAADGSKISTAAEADIEDLIDNFGKAENSGGRRYEINGDLEYIEHITAIFKPFFKGRRILLDTANGAASRIAPGLFRRSGADVTVINGETDGIRINETCGATHTEVLLEAMEKHRYDLGFTYDGDADRVMAVKDGKLYDGDHIMYIAARYFSEKGLLRNNCITGTVMTNMGTEIALNDKGLRLLRSKVGDKYVSEEMQKNDCLIGGETSGHLIFKDYQNTGDGLLSSLILAVIDQEKDIRLFDDIKEYPQIMCDILTDPEKIENFKNNGEINAYLRDLGGRKDIRTVVRASGTEPKIRIMAEAPTEDGARKLAYEIRGFILGRI